MAIFNSYVKLPEGKLFWRNFVVVVVVVVVFFPEFHGIHQECVETLCMITHEHHY